jgi:hypothetical protein
VNSNFVLQNIALSRKVHAMPTSTEAEEHLRVIRSLMEKATIYRAISAPVALIGGVISLLTGCVLSWLGWRPLERDVFGGLYNGVGPDPNKTEAIFDFHWTFMGAWVAVLAVTLAANGLFIWSDAQKRGDVFFSPGMKAALRALLPSMVVGGVFTLVFGVNKFAYSYLPIIWIICYGVGLLATSHFAPRSIGVMGWGFLLTGLLVVIVESVLLTFGGVLWTERLQTFKVANGLMATTFGLFHLIYAGCTWPRKTGGGA